jgi:hypothetical protein
MRTIMVLQQAVLRVGREVYVVRRLQLLVVENRGPVPSEGLHALLQGAVGLVARHWVAHVEVPRLGRKSHIFAAPLGSSICHLLAV